MSIEGKLAIPATNANEGFATKPNNTAQNQAQTPLNVLPGRSNVV
jgi:hypothetical protein